MITYKVGDATAPNLKEGEVGVIAHVCNDIGAWGAGFVLALSSKWPDPESAYKIHHTFGHIELGKIQMVSVEDNIWVANMVAQEGVGFKNGREPIRYDALIVCLRKLNRWIDNRLNYSVHMPRIGCGLAGGRWEIVEAIINSELCKVGIPVTVYDLEQRS